MSMCKRYYWPIPLVLVLLTTAVPLQARPAHRRALADHFSSFLAKKLNDCRTCHLPDAAPTAESEKPHNAFGARLKAVKEELRQAGKKTALADRLAAIAAEDSDGDGVSNQIELLTGHYPGEKDDRPTEPELARAPALVLEFRQAQNGYPWRPFERVERPPVPPVKNNAWVRNPIDAFIAAEREALGLQPRPEAPRHVLLRRLYIDLIGLPPTREELHAFLSDTSPDAYAKVVERLLNSPQYGERWGRHWMDVWRYSDWTGYGQQVRDSKPHIWRWRDWIIEALNEDKGYDQMLLEMLAADELYPTDAAALRATGYLVRNYKLLSREKWLQDVTEHTAMAFLGITLKCARCHDHMYDPFTQKEYYQFRAIFEPYNVRTERIPGQPDISKDGLVQAYDKDLTVPTYLFVRGDDRMPDKKQVMKPGVPEALGGHFPEMKPVELPRIAYIPDKRAFVIQETIATSEADVQKARAALAAIKDEKEQPLAKLEVELAEVKHQALLAVLAAEKLEDAGQKDTPAWKETATKAATAQRQASFLEARKKLWTAEKAVAALEQAAKHDAKKLDAARKNLTKAQQDWNKAQEQQKQPATAQYQPRSVTTYPATSTGRRSALARWLIQRDNPLTARVAVNHIWLRHFGQALAPTTFDLGRNGQRPTHPALLDWLAVEFMERGWSMREIHRLIVTSSTYRLGSTPDPVSARIDPDNKYLWRMTPRRVEAEVVRDSIFHVAGKLDLTMGGKEIPHPQGLTLPRRSLYFQHAAERQMPFLEIFDNASVTECYERKQAIMPQQALALHNSALVRKHARLLAHALHAQAKASDAQFITLAFEQVLSRAPTEAEQSECQAFLVRMAQQHTQHRSGGSTAAEPALHAREQLVHVLLNHHEFVTIR